MSNKNLHAAKRAKNDEFYTQYADIENELKHYTQYFKDKIIYCNCDDPDKSQFVKYFLDHFEDFGLKKLIATCYIKDGKGKALYCTTDCEMRFALEGDGDFRSDECIELLKEADIIVTNPPFSLFRDYISLLFKYSKDLIIVGKILSITTFIVFPLFYFHRLNLGFNICGMAFIVPDDCDYEKAYIDTDGKKKIGMGNTCWYTTFPVKQTKKLSLSKTYSAAEYDKFNNFNAINVDRIKDIPIDYDGLMGVPISIFTFDFDDEFEVIGMLNKVSHPDKKIFCGFPYEGIDPKGKKCIYKCPVVRGKAKFPRILIKKKFN